MVGGVTEGAKRASGASGRSREGPGTFGVCGTKHRMDGEVYRRGGCRSMEAGIRVGVLRAAVISYIAWGLLLVVVQIGAIGGVDLVALVAVPRALRLELYVPIRVRRVLEGLTHRGVPWVGPHGAAVDPDGLAQAAAGAHLDLVLQHELVHHLQVWCSVC